MIVTKTFQLTPQENLKLILHHYLLTINNLIIALVIGVFVIAISYWIKDFSYLIFYLLFMPLWVLFFIFIQWRFIQHPRNKFFFRKLSSEVDDQFIRSTYEDGSQMTYNWDSIVQCIKTKEYYLLYIGKAQFLYLPFSALKNSKDQTSFEEILQNRKLLDS